MFKPLTKKEQRELQEILNDPKKSREQALKAIEAWVRQEIGRSGKSSKGLKIHS